MNGSRIVARLAVCAALAVLANTGMAAMVYWSSGVVSLPDGTTAGAGDVTMYAFITSRQDNALKMKNANLYALINTDPMPDINVQYGAGMLTGTTGASGTVSLTDGYNSNSQYYNQFANVLFVCEQDGHEWYYQTYGENYDTASPPRHTNTNLASGAVWVQGNAIETVPEPTSAALVLFGCALLALRRRRRTA